MIPGGLISSSWLSFPSAHHEQQWHRMSLTGDVQSLLVLEGHTLLLGDVADPDTLWRIVPRLQFTAAKDGEHHSCRDIGGGQDPEHNLPRMEGLLLVLK